MLKTIFRKLTILLPLLLILSLSRLWYSATLGFKMQKIAPESFLVSTWQKNISSLPEDSRNEILSLLDQPFYFLGRGQQAYAFESKDKRYVIKFLRLPKYHPPFWTKLPYLPTSLRLKGMKVALRRDSFWKSCLKSVGLAESELKEETGLIFCHLEQTDDMQKVIQVHDRLGIGHKIDLDRYAFILQRKMEMIAPYLLRLHQDNDAERIKEALFSFRDAVSFRVSKKIRNKNRNCMRNLGVLEGKVVEFDVGELRVDPRIDSKLEMQKSAEQLKDWLNVHMPEFVSYL